MTGDDNMRTTHHLPAVVIGGGPAGLAISHGLSANGVDHLVLERDRVAERWRSERWDSLRLLTPNWMTRLPGRSYTGPDPDGYMTAAEVVEFLEGYAESFSAPVVEGIGVELVTPSGDGFVVRTDQGVLTTDAVVVATGATGTPAIPSCASGLGGDVRQLAARDYRSPERVAPGGVVVVGASASGLQIADELAGAGRDVTLAVGGHTRVPRTYRGHDIHWWLEVMGSLDRRADQVADLDRARGETSLQLVGHPDRADLDLNAVAARGVRLAGRLSGTAPGRLTFASDLGHLTAEADLRAGRLLERIDDFVTGRGLTAVVGPARRLEPTAVDRAPSDVDLDHAGVSTVLWATGYRRAYPWLDVPVVGQNGEIGHCGGVTPWPGLYAIGLPFLRRRKSTFIDGIGADAVELTDHIVAHLASSARRAA
jgi:putative flavoprotein involved in K+ transport